MLRSDYDDWADRHGTIFGFRAFESDFAMLDAWFDAFAAAGYGRADLDAATAALSQQPPKCRSDHLAAIHRAARERREKVRLAEQQRAAAHPDPAEVGVCSECGDGGWVVVPHPRHVVAGEWVAGFMGYRPLAAVACACPTGRRRLDLWDERSADYQRRVPRPMALDYYRVRVCPGWRAMMAADLAARLALNRADAVTAKADEVGGPLAAVMRRVRERFDAQESAA